MDEVTPPALVPGRATARPRTPGSGSTDGYRLEWLTSFLAVVDFGGFAAAAEGTFRSQPRISSHIGDLERHIGAELIAENPDIVIVTMGLNDAFSFDRAGDRIHEAIADDFERLRTGLPDARIVVFEPFWYTPERPAAVATTGDWVREEAAAIGADWVEGPNIWLDGHYAGDADSWMASDGIHPNDTGYAHIAERADEALRSLDPPL